MLDTFDIDNDLAEQRMMHEERQLRLVEALDRMELGTMTEEDKNVVWFECGLPRAAFRRIN
jgi:hypothetical protein